MSNYYANELRNDSGAFPARAPRPAARQSRRRRSLISGLPSNLAVRRFGSAACRGLLQVTLRASRLIADGNERPRAADEAHRYRKGVEIKDPKA